MKYLQKQKLQQEVVDYIHFYLKMAQNHFIRPLSMQYHDYTQQRILQIQQEIPHKFKQKLEQSYVKKPKIIKPPPPQTPRYIQPPKTFCQQYFPAFYNAFLSPQSSKPSIKQQQHLQPIQNKYKVGTCCIRQFQPQLCDKCVLKLCQQCRQGMCLKFRMCKDCKILMCTKCKQSLYFVRKLQLRNYQIPIKSIKKLHFHNCTCQQCLKFIKQTKKDLHQHQVSVKQQVVKQNNEKNLSQIMKNHKNFNSEQLYDSYYNQKRQNNFKFDPVESVIHH